MLLKLLLKIWPSLIPVSLYIFWILIVEGIILKYLKKKNYIEGEFEDVGKDGKKQKHVDHFSLFNPRFVVVIYLSLVALAISFLFFAINPQATSGGKYIPPQKSESGKIIPGRLID